jgi:ABC-type glycerol-3-phosphate transport system substrate-binding protein
MRRTIKWIMLLAFIVASILVAPNPSGAQDNTITLSLAVPNFQSDIFNAQLLGEFEAAHPGVKINVVRNDGFIPSATAGLDARFTELQKYAESADVLFIDGRRTSISPEDTQAGYFLDMGPLVKQDQALNVDDFYPAVWQTFQWDNGIWALPTATDAIILSYDQAAFDKVGLAYPSDRWTIDDVVNAAQALSIKDSAGAVITPGLGVSPSDSANALFISLIGSGLYDASTIPNSPQIDQPALEDILNKWQTLVAAGEIGGNFNDSPLSIGAISNLIRVRQNATPRVGIMLPGGKAGLTTQGMAISAGTQYPQQAYELASWLTTRAEVVNRFSVMPARRSLVNTQGSGQGQGGFNIRNNIPPELQAVIDQALANGLPLSEMRYTEYVTIALNDMQTNASDAKTALQTVSVTAAQNQTAAVTKKDGIALAVATAVPVTALEAGKVEIKFSMSSPVSPLPNQDKWNQVIADFVASDPQVGRVTLDTAPRFGQTGTNSDTYDCYYQPFNDVPNLELGQVLNLDPFLAADSLFDKADVIGNVIDQLSRDNKIWAYPIMIEPNILKYDATQFDKAYIPQPPGTWTIDEFANAVKALKLDPADPTPFVASNTNGSHLLILIAAYGGLPLDYRTSPATINFTDPKVVDAIRQALDLAKQGYIGYTALGGNTFGGGRPDTTAPIYAETLNAFTFRGPNRPSATTTQDEYKSVSYPTGSQMTAISYNIGTAYISANSQNPDACYRWISTLAKHPDLFSAMPARHSLINDPQIAATQGADTTALYNAIDKVLQDPNTISLPSAGRGGGGNITGFLVQHWLFQAFDSYVLNNGDLDEALKQAESISNGFQDCTSQIAPFDPATQSQRDYNQQFLQCATKVDPALAGLIGGPR